MAEARRYSVRCGLSRLCYVFSNGEPAEDDYLIGATQGIRDSMDVNFSGMFVATRSRQPRGPLEVRWVGNVTS